MSYVEANGLETYVHEQGDGPPVVFVHAAILDHGQFEAQLDRIGQRYRAIAYDVRGHGRTGPSPVDRYSIELFADDLAALVEALDLEDVVVCGHSTGGCIAQVYAARRPDELRGLVLASTFTPPYLSAVERLQRSWLPRAAIGPARLVGYERVERAVVWLNERLSGEAASGEYDRVRKLREEGPTMTTAEFAKVISALARFHETSLDLSRIDVPTLVLYGENEPGFVRDHAGRLARQIPGTRVRTIPGAGHASNLDNPQAFTAELEGFLEGLPSLGGSPGDRTG